MGEAYTYDYIIAGAGASGLSLAWRMMHCLPSDKRVLVVDRHLGTDEHKTWCFWHRGEPPFKDLVYHSWKHSQVYSKGQNLGGELKEYTYSCILSGEFTDFVLSALRKHPSFELLEAPVQSLKGGQPPCLITEDGSFSAEYIFQSCFRPPVPKKSQPAYPLSQHFLGWDVETHTDTFNPASFILMDFDDTFDDGLAFVYVLPWSTRKALVEYTIFSDTVKDHSFYEQKIELYLYNRFKRKRIDYNIARIEIGQIPMQDLPYVPHYAPGIINIGMAGGLTKPTTGFTFYPVQQHVKAIAQNLAESKEPALPPRQAFKYRAYDLWLLHIMYNNIPEAKAVFHNLFRDNPQDAIFKFLSEESTFWEDLRIMKTLPYTPFFKAMWASKKRLWEL